MANFNSVNLAEIYGNIDQARAQQAAQQANQMRMQQAQYEIGRQRQQDQRDDTVRSVYSGAIENIEGVPTLNEKRLLSDLYRVDPERALATQEKFTQRDATTAKTKSEKTKADLENRKATAAYLRDRLAGVQDQATYDAVMQEASELGAGFIKGAPREFNPEFVRNQLFTADEFLKQSTPKYEKVDLGGKIQVIDVNPMTNPSIKGTQFDKTLTPEAILTDKRTREEGAANRGVQIRGQNLTNQRAKEKNANDASSGGYSNKPLPATALKMQQEGLDKLSIASNNNAKLGQVLSQIDAGTLKLGLASNLEGKARNYLGASNESSRNLSSFKSTLEKLRNDSLRLNTGVQTDGDAQRAWNELFENINDQDLVKQRLKEIQEINVRGADLQKLQVENIRGNYNAPPIDFRKYEVKPPSGASGSFGDTPKRDVRSEADKILGL